jgi:type I restriction enzyme R subunit
LPLTNWYRILGRNDGRSNAPENARLTFDHVVGDRLQEMVESNFKFYKRITDDRAFSKFVLDWLFDRFRASV